MDIPSGRDRRSAPAVGTVGHFLAWWHGDPLPAVPAPAGLMLAPGEDAATLAAVAGLDRQALQERMDHGRGWRASAAGSWAGDGSPPVRRRSASSG